jgi:hypothetical protein
MLRWATNRRDKERPERKESVPSDLNADLRFKATGVGSMPFLDVKESCAFILKYLPDAPFWPQLVKRSHLEDMSIQYSEGLPLLHIDEKRRCLALSDRDMATELTTFYEHFLSEDKHHFSISESFAPGLYELVDAVMENPSHFGPFIKGQIVGPITFAAGIIDSEGKSVLYNDNILDAMVKGLAMKGLWQADKLASTGKRPILFLDEPYLSGFGSAFSPIQREKAIHILGELIEFVRERSDSLIGIHCCGNTDWSMLMESGPDVISFDAHGFMENFLLYSDAITAFIRNGGIIAWGILPTDQFTGGETIAGLRFQLEKGLSRLEDWGIDPELISKHSILTPACGMGSMEPSSAKRAIELLSQLSGEMRHRSQSALRTG